MSTARLRGPHCRGSKHEIACITEISRVSKESYQGAILKGIERANQTLTNVQGAWVKDQEVNLTDGKVTGF